MSASNPIQQWLLQQLFHKLSAQGAAEAPGQGQKPSVMDMPLADPYTGASMGMASEADMALADPYTGGDVPETLALASPYGEMGAPSVDDLPLADPDLEEFPLEALPAGGGEFDLPLADPYTGRDPRARGLAQQSPVIQELMRLFGRR